MRATAVSHQHPGVVFVLRLFTAALHLCYWAWAFFGCSEQGLLFVAVPGLLTVVASLVEERRLQGAWSQEHVGY